MTKTLAGATTTHFTWGLDGEVLAESNDLGQPLTEIIRLDGQPVAVVSSGALAQIHADHLGTPQAVTDATSTVTWSRAFRPFGEEAAATGTLVLNLRFPGQWLDAESGYRYNVFRDYDPSTGRYIQSDPIGLRGGWNTYAYVGGKPLRYEDPLGLQATPVTLGGPLPIILPSIAQPGSKENKAWVKWVTRQLDKCQEIVFSKTKNPPDIGPPNGWVQGPRRGSQYGPDGRPAYDIDKPHQGNQTDHVHEWNDGIREEPGRPVSPIPEE